MRISITSSHTHHESAMFKSLFSVLSCCFLLSTVAANTNDNLSLFAETDKQPRVLIELFTSQGCSSCPPADKWLGGLDNSKHADKVVPMALHIDYWDYIGWKDPFAQTQFTKRQRHYADLKQSNTVYTPQIMLNGKDIRLYTDFETAIDQAANQMPPPISLSVKAQKQKQMLNVHLTIDQADKIPSRNQVILAITENNLSTNIKRGENAGRTLNYSHVTRAFQPLGEATASLESSIELNPDWKTEHLTLVVFIQSHDGTILQTLKLPFSHPAS